jgi:hypothetical protein
MAVAVHYASVVGTSGDNNGYIMADAGIPNSAGNPTVKAYVEAEAASGFIATHISFRRVITYSAADLNAA